MSDLAIRVENLSKAYQLGDFGTGALTRDIERWWAFMRGKEDPFLKIGETNDRTVKGASDIVWSLRDINFEINEGDAVGIIGRNGAGKSTLLKILSRVTSPTTGKIRIKGRIASLLEVGTGFHPELTGGENIYLNGAIMGMNKREIKRKFDEIVDFSGVERYIDTPVKRYSSGMYVRLAFAVAAYLDAEILVVDEVLAVGDAEFQKKCLGKMNDVSKGQGRTVLFVSHNMASISALCNKGILLKNGILEEQGITKTIINKYIELAGTTESYVEAPDIKVAHQNGLFNLLSVGLRGQDGYTNSFGLNEDVLVEIQYQVLVDNARCVPSIHLLDKYGTCVLASINSHSANLLQDNFYNTHLQQGIYKVICKLPGNFLNCTHYTINVFLSPDETFRNMTYALEVISFEMHETGEMRKEYAGEWIGMIRPKLEWQTEKLMSI